jgi:hypothetical protein
MARRNARTRVSRITRSPGATTSLTRGVYSSAIANDAGGNFATSFSPTNFGLGAGASLLLYCPQLLTGVGAASAFRLRIRSMAMHYSPFCGPSASVGFGSGYVALLTQFEAPVTINFNDTAAAARSRPVRLGEPYSLTWKPTVANDKLWVRSDSAQVSLIPVDSTSAGCCFQIYTRGGTASVSPGTLTFIFVIECAMY